MITRKTIVGAVVCLMFIVFQGALSESRANDAEKPWVSRVISVQGHVLMKRQGGNSWQPVSLDDTLFAGDQIRVEANSRAGIVLSNDAVLRLDQNTTLVFTEIERPSTFIFRLLKGAANFFSHRPRSLKIVTPFVNGVVEGTEFYVKVDGGQAQIDLFEGRVLAQNDYGELLLIKGQGLVARAGQAPQSRILVRPRDSVQWALYYPSVLTAGPDGGSTSLKEIVELSNQGRTAEALERLEATAQKDRNEKFFTLRAGLLLNVGRVDPAREDIQKALSMDGANSDALALEAVIAVVQNRKDEALEAARKAVQSNSRSAAAHIALSYAHQAAFKLAEALRDTRAAVDNAPDNGTAWARRAELQLSTGELDRGIQSARKASALNPRIAHAHTILGFAYLTRIKTQDAREAFSRAIALDSAAPLPRLGLGLAKIRDGDLEEGRSQIEIAAGLDPSNALIRSYLGKAYFDEKRGPLDEQQLEIAKRLDPKDPTPWFYDAIRKQTLNRPVEALQDLQRSMELNDNRAVYRSRLLLDEDLAARSASIGRIFNDLDFEEMALRKAWDSITIDPSNYSAHRLLADTYAARPRHQIARVSELLQSQLYQPLNLTPLQPQLAESTLIVPQGMGIFDTSFNEFHPLFSRNRTTLQLDAIAGEQQTRGEDLTFAGLQQWFSYSLGQYHFETDGFRENNDTTQDIQNLFMQARIAETSSIQFEFRNKVTETGDLIQEFDPDVFSNNQREKRQERIPRIGIHYMPSANQHFITSLVFNYTDYSLKFNTQEDTAYGPLIRSFDRRDDIEAYNLEGQYLLQLNKLNLIGGIGYYDQDQKINLDDTVTFLGMDYPLIKSTANDARHSNAYLYSTISMTPTLKTTIGLSWDDFKKNKIEMDQLNPKFGLSWKVLPQTTIRAGIFRTLKRSLVTDQTIEPTQVAGFNQFYDDYLATDAKRCGIGMDHIVRPNLFVGADSTFGDLTIPIVNDSTGDVRKEDNEEKLCRMYLYWTPFSQLAISADYRFEYYSQKFQIPRDLPKELFTYFVPLGISYFHASGFFTKIRGQYINQKLEEYISGSTSTVVHNDDFFVFDASVGYRFPKRYGMLSLTATNLFDEEFNFFDGNYAIRKAQSPYVRPERQVLLKMTLAF